MSTPAVSVLIPFRNPGDMIQEALSSIHQQTFCDFEVVLINDHSSDSSLNGAQRWCSEDSRFRIHDNNGTGIVDALNTGLRLAEGEWIARMDADDISAPSRLSKQMEMAAKMGEKTVVSCQVRSFPDEVISNGFRSYENWLNQLIEPEEIAMNIFVESPIPHPTAFYHRKSIIREGGYIEKVLPEDYELWLRLWSRGFKFCRIPEVLLEWRDGPERLSRIDPAYSLTSFYRLKARYLSFLPALSQRKVLVAGSGQTARRLGKCLQAEQFEILAFIDPDRSRQGSRLRGRPVLSAMDAITEFSGIPILVASRLPGARNEIRQFLDNLGLREWNDFVFCS